MTTPPSSHNHSRDPHAWVRDNLPAYLAGGLEPDERLKLETHIIACPPCHAALSDLRELDASLRQLFAAETRTPARGLEDRIITHLRENHVKPRFRNLVLRRAGIGLAACIALGATGVLADYAVSHDLLGSARDLPNKIVAAADFKRVLPGGSATTAPAGSPSNNSNSTPVNAEGGASDYVRISTGPDRNYGTASQLGEGDIIRVGTNRTDHTYNSPNYGVDGQPAWLSDWASATNWSNGPADGNWSENRNNGFYAQPTRGNIATFNDASYDTNGNSVSGNKSYRYIAMNVQPQTTSTDGFDSITYGSIERGESSKKLDKYRESSKSYFSNSNPIATGVPGSLQGRDAAYGVGWNLSVNNEHREKGQELVDVSGQTGKDSLGTGVSSNSGLISKVEIRKPDGSTVNGTSALTLAADGYLDYKTASRSTGNGDAPSSLNKIGTGTLAMAHTDSDESAANEDHRKSAHMVDLQAGLQWESTAGDREITQRNQHPTEMRQAAVEADRDEKQKEFERLAGAREDRTKKLDVLIHDADQYQKQGQLAAAADTLKQVLAIDPSNNSAKLAFGLVEDTRNFRKSEEINQTQSLESLRQSVVAKDLLIPYSDLLVYPEDWVAINHSKAGEVIDSPVDHWAQAPDVSRNDLISAVPMINDGKNSVASIRMNSSPWDTTMVPVANALDRPGDTQTPPANSLSFSWETKAPTLASGNAIDAQLRTTQSDGDATAAPRVTLFENETTASSGTVPVAGTGTHNLGNIQGTTEQPLGILEKSTNAKIVPLGGGSSDWRTWSNGDSSLGRNQEALKLQVPSGSASISVNGRETHTIALSDGTPIGGKLGVTGSTPTPDKFTWVPDINVDGQVTPNDALRFTREFPAGIPPISPVGRFDKANPFGDASRSLPLLTTTAPALTELLALNTDTSPGVAASLPDTTPRPPTAAQIAARKIIRNGSVEYEVKNFDDTQQTVSKIVDEEGGFVASTNSDRLPNGKMRGVIILRVPPERLDTLVLKLRGLGELKAQQIGSSDISKQYTDMESKLRALRVMEERMLEIIKKGNGDVKQLVEAETKLNETRIEIEQIEGEKRYYDNLISMATLTVNAYEKDIRQAVAAIETERQDLGIETEDVEARYISARKIIEDGKGRITSSALKRLEGDQLNAVIVCRIPQDSAGPIVDQLRQLGRVARYTRDKTLVTDPNSTTAAPKTEIRDAEVTVSLYNLANIPPRETSYITVAVPDVQDVYAKLLEAARQDVETDKTNHRTGPAGKVINSGISGQRADQMTASVQLYLRTSEFPRILDLIKTAGGPASELLASSVTVSSDIPGTTTEKRGLQLTLQASASVLPRDTFNVAVAATSVKSVRDQLKSLDAAGKIRLVRDTFAEPNARDVNATMDIQLPETDKSLIENLIQTPGIAETSRSIERSDDTTNRTARKVAYHLTISSAEALQPVRVTAVAVEVHNVKSALDALRNESMKAGGREVDSRSERLDNGTDIAQITFEVPTASHVDLADSAKALGEIKGSNIRKTPNITETTLSREQVKVTFVSAPPIVPEGKGVDATIRNSLQSAMTALLASLYLLVTGILFLGPWLLVGWIIWKIIRRKKNAPAPKP